METKFSIEYDDGDRFLDFLGRGTIVFHNKLRVWVKSSVVHLFQEDNSIYVPSNWIPLPLEVNVGCQ
jgi:hypothetical protein